MGLKEYQRKRRFSETPEPRGKIQKGKGPLRFVVQMHEASRLHYDFRIEVDGLFRSWAVPKGPSLSPLDQRLAVKVEDHPMEYGSFEGIIPKGNYGAGTVMVWDTGTFLERASTTREQSEVALRKGLEAGHITLLLEGQKLHGEFALVRLKKGADDKAWLLIKKRDEYASYKSDITKQDRSVLTGRSMREIASEAPAMGDIWVSGQGRVGKGSAKLRAAVTASDKKVEKTLPKIPEHARGAENTPSSAMSAPRNPTRATTKKAKTEALPRKLKPMLATFGRGAFDGKGWIFERCWDGHRAIAVVDGPRSHIYSKQLLSFDKKFPEIQKALPKIPGPLVLDGEIVEENGPFFVVQDLLHANGSNIRDLPLQDRLKKLHAIRLSSPLLQLSETISDKGTAAAKKLSSAGAVHMFAKFGQSPYRSGTSSDWLKIKLGATRTKIADTSEAKPILTHLDKIYWPKEGYTKGDLIEYYRSMAPYILPYLKDRPESMNRFPDGITGKHFYHKDLTGYLPRWLKTVRVFSESNQKTIHFALCQNEASLLYLANLGCIELNPWNSRIEHLDRPDFVIIDLDPDDNDFEEVIEAAQETHKILKTIGVTACVKTSGATGIHICVPIAPRYDYDTARSFAEAVCRRVHQALPRNTSLERNPARRRGKIYLDFMQNARGQTLAAPYCVRPRPGATVSTPLAWKELKSGLRPEQFTIRNIANRVKKVGDLWKPMSEETVDLELALKKLLKLR